MEFMWNSSLRDSSSSENHSHDFRKTQSCSKVEKAMEYNSTNVPSFRKKKLQSRINPPISKFQMFNPSKPKKQQDPFQYKPRQQKASNAHIGIRPAEALLVEKNTTKRFNLV